MPVYEDFLSAGNGNLKGLVKLSGLQIGLGICWESLYADLSRQSARNGDSILVYLSDDTFAGDSITPWYHMRTTAMRAIETGRYAIFASQAGPFTAQGKSILVTPQEQGYWVVEIPQHKGNATPFIRLGNWFGWFCFILCVLLIIYSNFKKFSSSSIPSCESILSG